MVVSSWKIISAVGDFVNTVFSHIRHLGLGVINCSHRGHVESANER